MKQNINYKYVCLLMMLITVCLFGCSQTVMAAADDSITCGLSKESRSSAVVQKSRHTSNVKLYKCDGSYWKTIKNTNGRAVFPAVDSKSSNMVLGWSRTRGKHTLSASDYKAGARIPSKTADIIWYCLKHPWIVHHLLSPDRQNLTEFIWLETPGLLIQSVH